MEKPSRQSGLTIRGLSVGIVLTIVYVALTTLCTYSVDPSYFASESYYWYQFVIFSFFIPALVVSLLPKSLRLTPSELTIIFVMLAIAYPLTAPPYQIIYAMYYRFVAANDYIAAIMQKGNFVLPGFVRANDVIYPAGPSGRPANVIMSVPWGRWAPVIVTTVFWWILPLLAMIFAAGIFMRPYIEVENLPFPNAVPATEIIHMTKSEDAEKPSLFRNKWLWLGLLAAQVICLPMYAFRLVPGTTIESIRAATRIDLLIPYVPMTAWWMLPGVLGFSLIMPLNFLLSSVIVWIVIIVIGVNFAVYGLGIGSAFAPGATMYTYQWRALNGPFLFGALVGDRMGGLGFLAFDVMIASAAWTLWRHRRYIMSSLKSVVTPVKEFETEGQLSFRVMYLGAIICSLAYIAFAVWVGAYIEVVLFAMLVYALFFIGQSRARAECGLYGGVMEVDVLTTTNSMFCFTRQMAANAAGGIPSGEAADPLTRAPIFWTIMLSEGPWIGIANPAITMPTTLEALAVAQRTNTKTRDVMIAAIISTIIALTLGSALYIYLCYSAPWLVQMWGGDMALVRTYNGAYYAATGTPRGWRNMFYYSAGQPNPPYVPQFVTLHIIGIIIALFLFWAHARFSWWFFTPYAIYWWGARSIATYVFFMTLVAIVIKYLVTRVYGPVAFEKKMLPIAVGLIIGSAMPFVFDAMYQYLFALRWA